MQENNYPKNGSFQHWLGLFWAVPLDNLSFEVALPALVNAVIQLLGNGRYWNLLSNRLSFR